MERVQIRQEDNIGIHSSYIEIPELKHDKTKKVKNMMYMTYMDI